MCIPYVILRSHDLFDRIHVDLSPHRHFLRKLREGILSIGIEIVKGEDRIVSLPFDRSQLFRSDIAFDHSEFVGEHDLHSGWKSLGSARCRCSCRFPVRSCFSSGSCLRCSCTVSQGRGRRCRQKAETIDLVGRKGIDGGILIIVVILRSLRVDEEPVPSDERLPAIIIGDILAVPEFVIVSVLSFQSGKKLSVIPIPIGCDLHEVICGYLHERT